MEEMNIIGVVSDLHKKLEDLLDGSVSEVKKCFWNVISVKKPAYSKGEDNCSATNSQVPVSKAPTQLFSLSQH